MNILVFQNYPIEDAAAAGEVLEELGGNLVVIDAYGGEGPPDFSAGDCALVLGGPMNVYEEEKYPFLKWQTEWIARWAEEDRPLLGLCLGSQLLSKALGGEVVKNPVKEIGHYDVELTDEGRADPIFKGFDGVFKVIHWHGDTFTIPEGAVHLARNGNCRNQAMRFKRSYGLQFHLEINRAKMAEWANEYTQDLARTGIDIDKVLEDFPDLEAEYMDNCRRLIRNFHEIALG